MKRMIRILGFFKTGQLSKHHTFIKSNWGKFGLEDFAGKYFIVHTKDLPQAVGQISVECNVPA